MFLSRTYLVQILFVAALSIGSGNILEDKYKWFNIARYIIYFLTIRFIPNIYNIINKRYTGCGLNWCKLFEDSTPYIVVYIVSITVVVYYERSWVRRDFVYVFVALLVVNLSEMSTKPMISYGVGMACSYFEGYLVHVLPADGARCGGFRENIRALEDAHGVYFPVKKLFIIITKSLYCPPDLKHFNKSTDEYSYMESVTSLEDVIKNVAGVKDRQYRNTVYKIYRPLAPSAPSTPAAPAAPVYLAAECATPLHTLYRVLSNKNLYDELTDIDVSAVVEDFKTTLENILKKSQECGDKCEIVYYDNEDPTQNLADILLERIRQIEPKFEEKIEARRQQNVLENEPSDNKP